MVIDCKEFIRGFVPPVAVNAMRWMTHAVSPTQRYSHFKYLPKNIDVKWVMDIGANNGDVAKSALMSFKDCKVICFEPVSATFNDLTKNLEPYKDRVILQRCAVSDYCGKCDIYITSYPPANSIYPQSKRYMHYNPTIKPISKERINVITLDGMAIPGAPKIDILKIDVEGAELNVINGGKQFIKDYVDIIIIEISFARNNDYLNIFNQLDSLGFKLINIFDVNNTTYETGTIDDIMVTQIDCVFRKTGTKP